MKSSPRLIAVVRWLLLGVVGFLTLLAVFVETENWRGDRAWAAIEKELGAKGETLELSAFKPPAVPDEKNLFKAPNLALVLFNRPADQQRKRLLEVTHLMEYTDLGNFRGKLRDFPALRDQLRKTGLLTADYTDAPAADVLKALQPLQPLLDELREAARLRPQARLAWNPNPFESPTHINWASHWVYARQQRLIWAALRKPCLEGFQLILDRPELAFGQESLIVLLALACEVFVHGGSERDVPLRLAVINKRVIDVAGQRPRPASKSAEHGLRFA
jgi:hypothetical protein